MGRIGMWLGAAALIAVLAAAYTAQAQDSDADLKARLESIGVRDGAKFRDQGRWYLFAAGDGQAVGYNITRGLDGEMRKSGWSTDPAASAAEAQLGVGWRKGAVTTSLGVLQREVTPPTNWIGLGGPDDDDQMVAFSFSIRPRD